MNFFATENAKANTFGAIKMYNYINNIYNYIILYSYIHCTIKYTINDITSFQNFWIISLIHLD